MTSQTALYPGSFDPPTFGHLDMIRRAARLFNHLVVAIAMNNEKKCLFTVEERLEMFRETTGDIKNLTLGSFEGLTVNFAKECGAVSIVRGLRAISDFEFELSMATNNQKLNPEIDTVCLMPSEPYMFLSSRLVKEIAQFGGPLDHYVPKIVEKMLRKKLG